MEHPPRTADREGRGRQRGEQSGRHAVARGIRVRRPSRRRPLQQGGRRFVVEARGRSEAGQAVSGTDQVPVTGRKVEVQSSKVLKGSRGSKVQGVTS